MQMNFKIVKVMRAKNVSNGFFSKDIITGRKFVLRKKYERDEMDFFIVTYHNFIMK